MDPETKPTDGGNADLIAAREMADRRKRQLEEARTQVSTLTERLTALESKESERQQESEAAKQERQRKAGEFEALEADLKAKLAAIEAEREALTGEVGVYRDRTKAEIDQLLEGRDDADALRADLDGIPLEKQLSIIRRTVSVSDNAPVPSPGGQPRQPGGHVVPASLTPEQDAFAESQGWRTPEAKADFAQRLALRQAGREQTQAGLAVNAPKGGE